MTQEWEGGDEDAISQDVRLGRKAEPPGQGVEKNQLHPTGDEKQILSSVGESQDDNQSNIEKAPNELADPHLKDESVSNEEQQSTKLRRTPRKRFPRPKAYPPATFGCVIPELPKGHDQRS